MNKVVTMEQAVAMIKPGDFIINSGFLTSATPDALIQAVADSFEATGVPNNLTVMFGAGQGNRKGGQQDVAKEACQTLVGGHYGFSPEGC